MTPRELRKTGKALRLDRADVDDEEAKRIPQEDVRTAALAENGTLNNAAIAEKPQLFQVQNPPWGTWGRSILSVEYNIRLGKQTPILDG